MEQLACAELVCNPKNSVGDGENCLRVPPKCRTRGQRVAETLSFVRIVGGVDEEMRAALLQDVENGSQYALVLSRATCAAPVAIRAIPRGKKSAAVVPHVWKCWVPCWEGPAICTLAVTLSERTSSSAHRSHRCSIGPSSSRCFEVLPHHDAARRPRGSDAGCRKPPRYTWCGPSVSRVHPASGEPTAAVEDSRFSRCEGARGSMTTKSRFERRNHATND